MSVYDEIKAERDRQDERWGGPEHDDTHCDGDWVANIDRYTDKADVALNPVEFRRRMVQIAALAVAAIDSCDRKAGVSR